MTDNRKVRLVSIHDVLTEREPRSDPTLSKEPKTKKKSTSVPDVPRRASVR
jgi:hypothetical protein